ADLDGARGGLPPGSRQRRRDPLLSRTARDATSGPEHSTDGVGGSRTARQACRPPGVGAGEQAGRAANGGGTWRVARPAAPQEGGLGEGHICKVFNVFRHSAHGQGGRRVALRSSSGIALRRRGAVSSGLRGACLAGSGRAYMVLAGSERWLERGAGVLRAPPRGDARVNARVGAALPVLRFAR